MKTKKNAGEFFEIGDLVVARRTSCKVRHHVSASPTQNRTTLPRSNKGLFWFYTNSPNKSDLRNLSAVIVDSYFLDDKRELFVCLFPSGEYKPFGADELTLIQEGNKTT